MKKIINILMLLMCVCLVSCDDDSDATVELKVLEREMDITPAGGTLTATLTVDGDAVISDQSWCAASVSGKIVTVTLEPNGGLEGRTAMITVTKGQQSVSFAVTQPGNLFPDAGEETIEIDAHGGTKRIELYHGMPFTAECDASWLTAQVEGSTLVLTAQNNYTLNTLKATVKLTSADLQTELEIEQEGLVIVPEKKSVTMYNGGDEKTIKVRSTFPFTASCSEDWLTVVAGDDYVTVRVADNSDQPLRAAKVTLAFDGLTKTFDVIQRPTIYEDYLGKWKLTNSDNSFSYDLKIVQSEEGSSYKVIGWGKSEVAINSGYALDAFFDEETQYIYITQQTNLGVYSDDEDDYNVQFRGLVEVGGKNSLVNGSFICYIGVMMRDGSVQWVNNVLNLGGQMYELVGSLYHIESKSTGDIYSFKLDTPFMYSPIMQRESVAAPTRTRSIVVPKEIKSFAASQLELRK